MEKSESLAGTKFVGTTLNDDQGGQRETAQDYLDCRRPACGARRFLSVFGSLERAPA
jgi:hypothetical protein